LPEENNSTHIFAGNFNEDPNIHICTPLLDTLTTKTNINLTEFLNPNTYTWTNYRNTHRILDYILTSPVLTTRRTSIKTNTTSDYFETDHLAVIVISDLTHILFKNNGVKKRKRHKHNQPILDQTRNKEAQ
jgi:endonuclease/exonuclease/phosphatase family metal-dependent hydrolase